jgi:hypothetical protein
MSTTVPPRYLRVDLLETRADLENLVQKLDLPLDGVRDPEQLKTLMVLLDASHSLLKHAAAIAEHDGASLSPPELALVRVMIGELDGQAVDVDDLRYAIYEVMRPPLPADEA